MQLHLFLTDMYCMPQRVGQHHIISSAEPCTATKFLHLLDNVDSALEAIQFGNFLALLAEILDFVCLQVLFGDLIQIPSGGYKT